MPPGPLRYNRFLEILRLMDASIPTLPLETGKEFLIFRWGGSGYAAKPGGPRVAFMHRENHEPVTALEITKALRILGIPEIDFWTMADSCMVETSPDAAVRPERQESLPADPNSPSGKN